jgi:hypothetical protein
MLGLPTTCKNSLSGDFDWIPRVARYLSHWLADRHRVIAGLVLRVFSGAVRSPHAFDKRVRSPANGGRVSWWNAPRAFDTSAFAWAAMSGPYIVKVDHYSPRLISRSSKQSLGNPVFSEPSASTPGALAPIAAVVPEHAAQVTILAKPRRHC